MHFLSHQVAKSLADLLKSPTMKIVGEQPKCALRACHSWCLDLANGQRLPFNSVHGVLGNGYLVQAKNFVRAEIKGKQLVGAQAVECLWNQWVGTDADKRDEAHLLRLAPYVDIMEEKTANEFRQALKDLSVKSSAAQVKRCSSTSFGGKKKLAKITASKGAWGK